jgi:hypothetical protein
MPNDLESPGFTDGLASVSADWDQTPLVELLRPKIAALPAEQQEELWARVLSENRPAKEQIDADYKLEDHGVLPAGFLSSSPPDVVRRLSEYWAWHRARVIREMLRRGRKTYPMPVAGLARLLVLTERVDELSAHEASIARHLGSISAWLAMGSNQPMSVEDFGSILRLPPKSKSKLLHGEEREDFKKMKWGDGSADRAALHAIVALAHAVEIASGHETPVSVALFRYKASIELFASGGTNSLGVSTDELELQKDLCKFLLSCGIFSVGTKFGQSHTDLVAQVNDEYIVIETKVYKGSSVSGQGLEKNLLQLLRYESMNPAFRGRRAILLVYNFTPVPMLSSRDTYGGNAWIWVVNVSPFKVAFLGELPRASAASRREEYPCAWSEA